MSLRPGLLPLLRAAPRTSTRSFHFLSNNAFSLRSGAGRAVRQSPAGSVARAVAQRGPQAQQARGSAYMYSIGLGIAAFSLFPRGAAQCASPQPVQTIYGGAPAVVEGVAVIDEEPVESIVNVRELSFGAVCGIAAGVFVKKGFKAVAFVLGGVYVLLQYLSSRSFISVDWKAVQKSYDGAIGSVDAEGRVVYPTVHGVLNNFIDFLTANFQQRATFIAGFILGLRIG